MSNKAAIDAINEQITKLTEARDLLAMLDGSSSNSRATTSKRPSPLKGRKRKPMSAATRAKIAAATKLRWAKQRAGKK
jgi:hypothetical protein